MERQIYVFLWTADGVLVDAMPLSQVADLYGLSARKLHKELVRIRYQEGRDPAPLKIASKKGDSLLTLTPVSPLRIWGSAV